MPFSLVVAAAELDAAERFEMNMQEMQSGALRDIILSYSVLSQGILTSCALTLSRLDDFSDIVTFVL